MNRKSCTVSTVCKACGSEGQLDVTHRLTQFIVKNPPENEMPPTKAKSRKSKKGKSEAEKNSGKLSQFEFTFQMRIMTVTLVVETKIVVPVLSMVQMMMKMMTGLKIQQRKLSFSA